MTANPAIHPRPERNGQCDAKGQYNPATAVFTSAHAAPPIRSPPGDPQTGVIRWRSPGAGFCCQHRPCAPDRTFSGRGSGLVPAALDRHGDHELDDRSAAREPQVRRAYNRAIDPLARQLALAAIVRRGGESAAEAMRLAAELARTLDALTIEEVPASKLADAAAEAPELAGHWQVSLDRLQAIIGAWPAELARRGAIDLSIGDIACSGTAKRWRDSDDGHYRRGHTNCRTGGRRSCAGFRGCGRRWWCTRRTAGGEDRRGMGSARPNMMGTARRVIRNIISNFCSTGSGSRAARFRHGAAAGGQPRRRCAAAPSPMP